MCAVQYNVEFVYLFNVAMYNTHHEADGRCVLIRHHNNGRSGIGFSDIVSQSFCCKVNILLRGFVVDTVGAIVVIATATPPVAATVVILVVVLGKVATVT